VRADGVIRGLGQLGLWFMVVTIGAGCGSIRSAGPASTRPATHAVAGPACAGGAGKVIPLPRSLRNGAGNIATTVLANGTTLVVVSSGSSRFAIADAFTPRCTPEKAFGDNGVERLAFGGRSGVTIAAVSPATGGGAILAGGTTSGSLVARIDATGQLEPTFGTGGLTMLPWPGAASAVTEAPSGDIVVGGSQGGGCCVHAWVGELSAHGGVISQFGSAGQSAIPVYRDDSGIGRVAVEPNGDILALVPGGNMGNWGVSVTALTSSGAPVPSFQRNFNAGMQKVLPSGIFAGDLVVRPGGFLLVGTSQNRSVTDVPDPSATGRVIAFQPDGKLAPGFAADGEASFSFAMAQSVWALPQLDGRILMAAAPPAVQEGVRAPATIRVVGISADGSIDHTFGDRGAAQLQLRHLSQFIAVIAVATNGHLSVVAATTFGARSFQLTQIAPD
jgi:hypothetical protein